MGKKFFLLFLCTVLNACTFWKSDAPEICPTLNEQQCNASKSCAFQLTNACVVDSQLGFPCDMKCVPAQNRCQMDVTTVCRANYERKKGKSRYTNLDIVGCSSYDGLPRCELHVLPEGGKVCVVRADQDPCRGCLLQSQGQCKPSSKCFWGFCFRSNLG